VSAAPGSASPIPASGWPEGRPKRGSLRGPYRHSMSRSRPSKAYTPEVGCRNRPRGREPPGSTADPAPDPARGRPRARPAGRRRGRRPGRPPAPSGPGRRPAARRTGDRRDTAPESAAPTAAPGWAARRSPSPVLGPAQRPLRGRDRSRTGSPTPPAAAPHAALPRPPRTRCRRTPRTPDRATAPIPPPRTPAPTSSPRPQRPAARLREIDQGEL